MRRLAFLYHENGCGALSSSEAYAWEGGIVNLYEPDRVVFDDLIGYEHHKKRIINNTKAFLEGKPCNNILLFGDRGTGKSSCVKATFNMFKNSRLRIIELSKRNISQIQDVMDFIRNRGMKFILFLDDLSFEETEVEYKELKAQLEGGLESQPANVVIYATSNRFHIVRETQSDNTGIKDDIHLNDAIQEKLSLSDRFGITITFDTPSPKEYLNIVRRLLERNDMTADEALLKKLAYRWEIANHGRSGRSAVQFVKSVMGRIDEDVILDENT
jgi:predicted AAA+ superfamily ATPase